MIKIKGGEVQKAKKHLEITIPLIQFARKLRQNARIERENFAYSGRQTSKARPY